MRSNWKKPEIQSERPEKQRSPSSSTEYQSLVTVAQNPTVPKDVRPQTPPDLAQRDSSAETSPPRRLPLPGWQFWAVVLVLVCGGVGFGATSLLLKLPSATNCMRIFWPLASASTRIYCAQVKAEEKTLEGFLAAIELVKNLPEDHPLRDQINSNVEEWAKEILSLAEKEFQQGNIDKAIATARKIPTHLQAYSLVAEKIERWQSIWSEAKEIYDQVERHLRAFEWNQAFRAAVQLIYSGNQYWSTTKYQEALEQIQVAQEESRKLDGAYVAYRRGGVDNLLEAIEVASQIESKSYAYQEAQELIDEAKNKLLAKIEKLVDNQDWQDLQQIADRLPASLDLQEQVSDWKILASAGLSAQGETVASLEAAIAEAEKMKSNRPLYHEAQELISRWKVEIQDLTYLAQARQLAQPGTINDLNAAVAQAKLIPPFNPRYQEASQEIRTWTNQIETIEDRPLLERAQELAAASSLEALQQAIAQASLIGSNRALYQEAQNQIGTWRTQIEQRQDQPVLDQAVVLARAGNLDLAIDTARQIRRERVLYREAQAKVREWRQEVQARENLDRAYRLAESKTPEALAKAIKIARRIPAATEVRSESDAAINSWAEELLGIAQNTAAISVEEAIAIAKMIPSGTFAYESAKANIASWEASRQSPLPENPPVREGLTGVEFSNPTSPTPVPSQF